MQRVVAVIAVMMNTTSSIVLGAEYPSLTKVNLLNYSRIIRAPKG